MTEKELILAAQKGSQIAYEELIRLRQKVVYYLAFFLCGNDERADAIARGAFETAWQQITYLERMNRSFLALLCSLASAECEKYVRHQKHRISGVIRLDGGAASPETDAFLEKLSALPFHRRRILLLVDMCGLSVVETAEILASSAEDVTSELEAARNAAPVAFAEAMAKLPEPPKSFSHEVIDDINRSSEKSADGSAAKEYRPGRRFAFGRFTIIAACVALLLLAYSGGFLGRRGPALTPPSSGAPSSSQSGTKSSSSGSSSQSGSASKTDTSSGAGSSSADGSAGNTATMPEDTAPDGSTALVPGDSTAAPDGTSSENGGSAGGDSANKSYIPSGEKYSAVYLSGTSAASTLSNYCAGSFRASLPDGNVAIYYMIPNANIDTAIAALESAGITYAVYDGGDSIDAQSGSALFILFD
jgi:DNA-directed RNA polymerase specialized sigma24 family protein